MAAHSPPKHRSSSRIREKRATLYLSSSSRLDLVGGKGGSILKIEIKLIKQLFQIEVNFNYSLIVDVIFN